MSAAPRGGAEHEPPERAGSADKWLGSVSWRDALVIGAPVLALLAATFWLASRYVQPAPPDHLVMATGPAGGTYQRYGEQYRRYLEPYGVTLELRPSSGSVENFAWLRDNKVDVAFVQGGEGELAPAEAGGEPPVVSLGALYYEPMWVFQAGGAAPAYAKRHGRLTALTVPRGVVDIPSDLPPRDVSIVAVTANLLARNELHPALTYLLLDTAATVNSAHARLAEAGTFPNARGQDVPIAEEAQRYYKSGKPFLQRYLPYWAANFVDRMLILLIPIFAVLIPAIKLVPILYTYRLKARIVRWYAQLGGVERELTETPDPARIGEWLARLDGIEAEVGAARLPKWFGEETYLLRAAIDLVRERLGTRDAKAIPAIRDRRRDGAGPPLPADPAQDVVSGRAAPI